jgi:hypothetical protein
MNPSTLDAKSFALVGVHRRPDAHDEPWTVLTGTLWFVNNALWLQRSDGQPSIQIRPEWLDGIREAEPELREKLQGADYYLALTIGTLATEGAVSRPQWIAFAGGAVGAVIGAGAGFMVALIVFGVLGGVGRPGSEPSSLECLQARGSVPGLARDPDERPQSFRSFFRSPESGRSLAVAM